MPFVSPIAFIDTAEPVVKVKKAKKKMASTVLSFGDDEQVWHTTATFLNGHVIFSAAPLHNTHRVINSLSHRNQRTPSKLKRAQPAGGWQTTKERNHQTLRTNNNTSPLPAGRQWATPSPTARKPWTNFASRLRPQHPAADPMILMEAALKKSSLRFLGVATCLMLLS